MLNNSRFPKLFSPAKLGKIEIKNRIIMAAMGTNLGSTQGYVTQSLIDYYEARARGGVGLVTVEGLAVDPRGRRRFTELAITNDRFIPGLRRLVEAVHKHGAKIAPQLLHRGQQGRSVVTGQQPVSPSPFSITRGEVPHELTINEIAGIVSRFGAAAGRVKKAGFDGIEIHAAHIYLISQFLSAAANKRSDQYGGSVQNRARFLIEVIRSIKETVGPDFPVWCRLSVQEYGIENGITLDETKQVVRMAEQAGIDAIDVSIFGYGAQDAISTPYIPGAELPLAAEIKKVVKVPVITVGWLNPEVGERALQEGKADFIGIGRRLIADPEIANKASEGKVEDIRPCLGCNECMQSVARYLDPVHCSVNAAVGKERQYRIRPASRKKKVLVIGGGPAGLEAATIAALRGHRVTLFERNNSLGGTLNLASVPPDKEPVAELARYLSLQAGKAGINIRLGQEATSEFIIKSRPDAVIIASGAIPSLPSIPGIDRPSVLKAVDVLSGKAKAGKRVVIIGGGMVGCEVAHFLAAQGHSVTILEILDNMASDITVAAVRMRLMDGLASKGVRLLNKVQCEAIGDDDVTFLKEGNEDTLPTDSVVIATGSCTDPRLFRSLKGMVPELFQVGDVQQPARITEAVESGLKAGFAV